MVLPPRAMPFRSGSPQVLGQSVSFAAMLTESNDWFFATGPDGIPLFTDGVPTSGDVTKYVSIWDAGTEANQEPAVGDADRNPPAHARLWRARYRHDRAGIGDSTVLADGTTFRLPRPRR